MDVVTRWAFRAGVFCVLGGIIGSLCLAALDLEAPSGTSGNRDAVETVVGALFIIFIGLGFVVFVGALTKVRDVTGQFTPTMKVLVIGALAATNFFGGYIFFLVYPRLLRGQEG